MLDETVLSSLWLRALGASVGKNASIEQPYILEPDLVSIGDDCVMEFETQLNTSEIKAGLLEFRRVTIGNRVKIGVRSVLLGGTRVADGSEIRPKSALDFYTKTENDDVVEGAPARVIGQTDEKPWRPERNYLLLCFQMIGIILMMFLMAAIAFVGASIGLALQETYGSIALIVYLGAVFSTLSSLLWLGLVALLYRILFPNIQPYVEYSGTWFLWRKWFLDRLFLSPMFSYASQRTLQTSSTFPWYLKLLGADIGHKAWMNHPYIRVGKYPMTVTFASLIEIHMAAHSSAHILHIVLLFRRESSQNRVRCAYGNAQLFQHRESHWLWCIVLADSGWQSRLVWPALCHSLWVDPRRAHNRRG